MISKKVKVLCAFFGILLAFGCSLNAEQGTMKIINNSGYYVSIGELTTASPYNCKVDDTHGLETTPPATTLAPSKFQQEWYFGQKRDYTSAGPGNLKIKLGLTKDSKSNEYTWWSNSGNTWVPALPQGVTVDINLGESKSRHIGGYECDTIFDIYPNVIITVNEPKQVLTSPFSSSKRPILGEFKK